MNLYEKVLADSSYHSLDIGAQHGAGWESAWTMQHVLALLTSNNLKTMPQKNIMVT
jgi:hypothetical protein